MSIFSCKTTRYTADNLPPKQIVFGKGGGITGAITSYILLENGQVFLSEGLNDPKVTEYRKIGKRKARKLFEQCDSLMQDAPVVQSPGNVYHFMEFKGEAESGKMIWGNPDYQCPAAVEGMYKDLREKVIKTSKNNN